MHNIFECIHGNELTLLNAMSIHPPEGGGRIRCPYPDHEDRHPSWRWNWKKGKALCSCCSRYHSIIDVIIKMGIAPDFKSACSWIREQLGDT